MLAERPHPSPHLAPWQVAWREGFAPLLSTAGLEALRSALLHDSPAVIQGETAAFNGTDPDRSPPTAAAVEAWWVGLYDAAERRLGDGLAGLWELLDFIDESPRAVVRRGLMLEVGRELARRAAGVGAGRGLSTTR